MYFFYFDSYYFGYFETVFGKFLNPYAFVLNEENLRPNDINSVRQALHSERRKNTLKFGPFYTLNIRPIVLFFFVHWFMNPPHCKSALYIVYAIPSRLTTLSSPPVFNAPSFIFCVMFFRSLFVLLSLFTWPLSCLSFVLRFLITSLCFTVSNHPFWYLQLFSNR